MPKILHLIFEFEEDSGGAQRVIADIINSIEDSNYVMGVCSLLGDATLSHHLPNSVYNNHFRYSNKYSPRILLSLFKLLKDWQPDILHVHSPVVGFLGRPIAKLLGIKLISTIHNDVREISIRNRILDKMTIGLSDALVCVSKIVEKSVLNEYQSIVSGINLYTIKNCIDCVKFRGKIKKSSLKKRKELDLEGASFVIGTVGSLHPQKGQEYLLEAWRKVIVKFPDAVLLLVGDGKEKNKLKKLSANFNISNTVRFLGSRNDVPEILNLLDIFVFPSNYEGLSIALLEAMCMNKIIIASDIPHIKQVLNSSGIYTPPRNSDLLGKKIITVLNNYDSKIKYGKKAKKRLDEEFSLLEFSNSYKHVYNQLGTK